MLPTAFPRLPSAGPRLSRLLAMLLLFLHLFTVRTQEARILPPPAYHPDARLLAPSYMARIAFVFAGSARSFVNPAVHESIRFNLIRALCPTTRCVGDVFVRLSTSDNNHRGYDSIGVLKNATSFTIMRKIEAALERLKTPAGKLIVKRVDIGGAVEAADMDAHIATHAADWDAQMRHRVYRHLDGRRYSMYFSRFLAYLMVMLAEDEQSALLGQAWKYDWVVHARLDAGWGEPLLPWWKWSPKKMYTPNSWFADVPDTFAMSPRYLSDVYFSLDSLIKTTIICLGGPNFDPKTATPEYLQKKLGWGDREYAVVHRELCLTQHPTGFHLIHDKKNNLYWSMSGFSEYFLKRKLSDQGVTLQNANIDYYPFFIFIVREPLGFVCFYLDPQYFMPWVKTWQSAAGASASGCYGMHDALNRLYDQRPDLTSCDARRAAGELGQFADGCQYSLLDGEVTDWDFNPFRIRHKSRCMGALPSRVDLNTSECINFFRKGEFFLQYKPEQLYFFQPMIQGPQRIMRFDWDSRRECLTVIRPTSALPSSQPPTLQMRPCEMHNTRVKNNPQLFIIDLLDREKLDLKLQAAKVMGWEKARPLLGPVTKSLIRWVGDRTDEDLQTDRELRAATGADASSSPAAAAVAAAEEGEGDEVGLIGAEDRSVLSFLPSSGGSGNKKAPKGSVYDGECVTVRRLRSKSFVGQFETQIVLRPCPPYR